MAQPVEVRSSEGLGLILDASYAIQLPAARDLDKPEHDSPKERVAANQVYEQRAFEF